jgi:FkbM family methyltransferase
MNQTIKHYLTQFLPENPVILEAGAHIGRDTIKLLKIWLHARIYAFEPVPELHAQLLEKTKNYAQISCYPYALGTDNGNTQFFFGSGRSTAASSLLKPELYTQEHPDVVFAQITVPVRTLDQWAHEQAISAIDFLWLDMQGSEMAMLQASPHLLRTVRAIHTEVNLTQRYTGVPEYHVYRTWLEQQGFTHIFTDMYKITWGNALFLRA